MDVVSNNYMPGDPRLIDHIVYELKSQGIFDNFRKECIADVDTKPAYQNLRQRVEGSVIGFLKTQKWRPDMNKNQVREMLRKNISESGFLETGVERIVDQVVNPKINSIFLPQVENVVYKVLGIQKPSTFDEVKALNVTKCVSTNERLDIGGNNLLPSDLETVSPESEPHERKLDVSNESQKLDNSRMDEDESPPFEPLEETTSFMVQEENSVDSHLSGFSGLASHDSNHSFEVSNKIVTPMEISNQDSQFSKQSSDDHLSIVMSDDTETKLEVNEEDSSQSKISKTTDSNSKSFDFMQDSQNQNSQSSFKQDKTDASKKIEDKPKTDEKKTEKHRSSDKHKSRHDSKSESRDRKNEKDKKSDRDKKEHRDKSKYSSKDGKDRDKDKKDGKSKSGRDERDSDKEHKHEKDRDRSKSSTSRHSSGKDKSSSKKDSATKEKAKESSESKDSSKTKELESKDLKTKESESKDSKTKELEQKDAKTKESSAHKESKTKDSKERSENSRSRDDSKSKSESKSSHTSAKNKGDSKNHSKHNGKTKSDLSDVDKSSSKSNKKDDKSYRKDDKDKHHSRSDKYSSNKKDDRRDKDKKDPKKDVKKVNKDDHYGLKGKNTNRRSTDRDSSDGHSGTHSSSSSFADSSTSLQKPSQDNSTINSRSNSGESGNSEQVDGGVISQETSAVLDIQQEDVAPQITPIQQLPVKLIKPKFASNIFEARRLMKIRKKLGKIEKQSQMELIKTGLALKNPVAPTVNDSILTYEIVTVPNEPDTPDDDNLKRRPNILKKSALKPSKVNSLSSKLNLNRGLKGSTAQFFRNKTKSSNHKKTNDQRKNAEKTKVLPVPVRKVDSEEENVAEVVEVSDVDDCVPSPLQNSVISKESWDAVEAKLIENVMKAEYNSYRDSYELVSDCTEVPSKTKNNTELTKNDDCLGFSPELPLETQRYREMVHMLIGKLEGSVARKETLIKIRHVKKETTPSNTGVDRIIINKRLPKVAIVDVTSDSEIIISPRKGIKRHASDHPDVHNNNNKMNARLEEDRHDEKLNHTKVNPPTKPPSVPSKAKKAKLVDSTANHLDTFNLPLSPAESDKSFTSSGDRKSEKDESKVKRNSNINRAANNSCNQRYSTDDLYKPRLQFTSSRRRAAKNRDTN